MDSDLRITIEEALTGDHAAFEALIRQYSRTLYSIAFGYVQQAAAAEDIVQETFLKAYQKRKSIREPEKFPSWLYSIARHTAHDALRKRPLEPLPENFHEAPDESAPHPRKELEGSELRQKIQSLLHRLPEHHRVAITLRYLDGLDHPSIEAAMGLSNGALRGILGRALETLRQSMKPSIIQGI